MKKAKVCEDGVIRIQDVTGCEEKPVIERVVTPSPQPRTIMCMQASPAQLKVTGGTSRKPMLRGSQGFNFN